MSDLEATQALGAELAQRLPAEAILLLKGPLGAGKTSLVQGIALALGIGEPITSPTFALAQHYTDGNPPLIHLDLYRLEQSTAADDLFLQEDEEAKAIGAFMAVEWPERLSLDLPEAWQLQLSLTNDGGRRAQLTPPKNAST
nr:tRNA (adenosine(37)-N6)-threonylcarbamoyltransferase complex ATPase subunit type 1 TsaE [Synechococcus sp. CC9902]